MILAVDVQYHKDGTATVAGVLFKNFTYTDVVHTLTKKIDHVEAYEPGFFYKRELPCILSLLEEIDIFEYPIKTIVIDGYVTLGSDNHDGLGMHLYNALNQSISVVGVAKTPYPEMNIQSIIYRGKSNKPLYVTVTPDLDLKKMASFISDMRGKHRIPTLLKLADQLARGIEQVVVGYERI